MGTWHDCPLCGEIALDLQGSCLGDVKVVWYPDNYPVTDGHLLVLPVRHVQYLHELTDHEIAELWHMVANLSSSMGDCNIGINNGPLAGQTIPHLHVHIIPRRAGDVVDPRGGVRWVIPDKADYWTQGKKGK